MLFSFDKSPVPPMEQAMSAFRDGRIQEAEARFRAVVAAEPGNGDALHLVGVICFRTGRVEEGIGYLRRAVAAAPGHAAALGDLGEILRGRGELVEAEEFCRRAVAVNGESAVAQMNLAKVLASRQKLEEAATVAKTAAALAPQDPNVQATAGLILFYRGQQLEAARAADPATAPAIRTDLATCLEAARHMEEAVRRSPGHAGYWMQLALTYERLELYDRAYHAHKRAVELQPNDVEVTLSMAHMLNRLLWLEEGEAFYRRALALQPDHRGAREQLATVLMNRGKLEEAATILRQRAAESPEDADLHAPLAETLVRLGRFDEALAGLRKAVAQKPSASLYQALSTAYLRRGEATAALEAVDRAIALEPHNVLLPFNKGVVLAMMGRLEEAWPLLEYRWRNPNFTGRARNLAAPRWDGRPLNGGRVVLLAEQGLGDTVQYVRYAALVRERGGVPVVWCPATLVDLVETVPGVAEVVPEGPNLATLEAAAWLPLMSLPAVFGTTLETIPASVPYMAADPAKAAQWRDTLASHAAGLKIGLVWAVGPLHPESALRSTTLAAFAPLAEVPNVTFFGLQKGPAEVEAHNPPAGMRFVDLSPQIRDFADTAAILASLDLLITVDTSVAHVAGAMGRSVWNLLSQFAGYTWMLGREDTPWYPTMRLFRQPAYGDWDSVIQRVRDALTRLAPTR